MSDYINEYDKRIFKMMSNPDWWIDKQKKRKLELLQSTKKINCRSSISKKMGGILLWQQVIEQFLKEIIDISISYIKAEIWPARVDLSVKYDNLTFGSIITTYNNKSIEYKEKQQIINKLNIVNTNRNKIVHKIFEVEDISDLENYFQSSFTLYPELLDLLLYHYQEVCYILEDLRKRVDWESFLEEIESND